MPTTATTAERTRYEPREQRLAEKSELFEIGALSDEISDECFILRLNTLVARRDKTAEGNVPADLSDAISAKGELDTRAELVAFGHWLLIDGRPGMTPKSGKQPDQRIIYKCVALAMFERRIRPVQKAKKLFKGDRDSRKQDITKRDLSERWPVLFGDKKEPSFFDARLRSMKHILPAYLEHLTSGTFMVDGKQIKTSPEIKKVLKAISGKSTPRPVVKASELIKPVTQGPANLSPFEIELRYSSPAQEDEYRNLPGSSEPLSSLRYLPNTTSSTSPTRAVRADREGKIVLVPDIAVRDNYKIEALIDRMVVLINTKSPTAPHYLFDKILKATGAKIFAHDLKKNIVEDDWGAPLPITDSSKLTGQHFAIMIQDPTPELVPAILNVIRDGPGIDGSVSVHLIEVSVDFYPRSYETSEESILLREQMVGLLQRHHWTRHQLFLEHAPREERDVDARQLYKDPGKHARYKKKIRYLFSHGKPDAQSADCKIALPNVRRRILTDKPGERLHLDASLVKGPLNAIHHVRIQHKITNRRNLAKNTVEYLPNHKRRARIEVTISGRDTLQKQGISTIGDLDSVSFRTLAKPFLSFTLAEIEPVQHILDDAQVQMRTRGVYGVELRSRARALEGREELRRSGEKLPRNTDREGRGLQSWQEMNGAVGRALDKLSRRWTAFSWR